MHLPHQLHGIESQDEPLLTLWAERVVTHEEAERMSDDREDGGTTDSRYVKTVLFFLCFVQQLPTHTYPPTYLTTCTDTYRTYLRTHICTYM